MAGRPGDESLTLPISIPVGADGTVLLEPGGPLDAPRVPAWLRLTRPYGIRIERQDGGPMRIPGIDAGGDVTALSFDVGERGMSIEAAVALRFDDGTACALANALHLTLRRKIATAAAPATPGASPPPARRGRRPARPA